MFTDICCYGHVFLFRCMDLVPKSVRTFQLHSTYIVAFSNASINIINIDITTQLIFSIINLANNLLNIQSDGKGEEVKLSFYLIN
jgi:hypothetical protein